MNRTFLNILIICSVVIIALFGQKNTKTQHDYTPWDVTSTENGSFYVFGITLGKTTIEEANQILSSFAKSVLVVGSGEHPQLRLLAIHKELVISGVITDLHLNYNLEQSTLHDIYSKLTIQSNPKLSDTSYTLPPDIEMQYLSTPISSITYYPSIDYGEDTILQRFGSPTRKHIISDNERVWVYPEIGLELHLFNDKTNEFIYRNRY